MVMCARFCAHAAERNCNCQTNHQSSERDLAGKVRYNLAARGGGLEFNEDVQNACTRIAWTISFGELCLRFRHYLR